MCTYGFNASIICWWAGMQNATWKNIHVAWLVEVIVAVFVVVFHVSSIITIDNSKPADFYTTKIQFFLCWCLEEKKIGSNNSSNYGHTSAEATKTKCCCCCICTSICILMFCWHVDMVFMAECMQRYHLFFVSKWLTLLCDTRVFGCNIVLFSIVRTRQIASHGAGWACLPCILLIFMIYVVHCSVRTERCNLCVLVMCFSMNSPCYVWLLAHDVPYSMHIDIDCTRHPKEWPIESHLVRVAEWIHNILSMHILEWNVMFIPLQMILIRYTVAIECYGKNSLLNK